MNTNCDMSPSNNLEETSPGQTAVKEQGSSEEAKINFQHQQLDDRKRKRGEDGDHDDDESEASMASSLKSGEIRGLYEAQIAAKTFPEQLWTLIEDEAIEDIKWSECGENIEIRELTLQQNILDRFMQGLKFDTFRRKLNRWGFKRAFPSTRNEEWLLYYNKNFRKGQKDLIKFMRCVSKKAKAKSNTYEDSQEDTVEFGTLPRAPAVTGGDLSQLMLQNLLQPTPQLQINPMSAGSSLAEVAQWSNAQNFIGNRLIERSPFINLPFLSLPLTYDMGMLSQFYQPSAEQQSRSMMLNTLQQASQLGGHPSTGSIQSNPLSGRDTANAPQANQHINLEALIRQQQMFRQQPSSAASSFDLQRYLELYGGSDKAHSPPQRR